MVTDASIEQGGWWGGANRDQPMTKPQNNQGAKNSLQYTNNYI